MTSFTGIDAITEIDASAFAGCEALATLNSVAEVTTVGENAFAGCALVAPEFTALKEIGASAFAGCKSLTDIQANEVSTLGISAFSGCESLTTLPTLASTITVLPKSVFAGCAALESVTLANIETIGDNAFSGCTKLASIEFAAATSVGAKAFANTGLTSIDFGTAILGTVGEGAFEGVTYSSCAVTVKDGSTGTPDADTSSWLDQTWSSVTVNS